VSGLRDPAASVRGVGGGALAIQALVLLLAIAPLARLGGTRRGPAIVVLVALAVLAVVLAGLLRRPWAWHAAFAVPAGLIAAGWLHWSLAVLGVLYGLLWAYVLHVRRSVTANGSPSG
jgi:hypothetical protein